MSDRKPAPHDHSRDAEPRRVQFAPKLGFTADHLRFLNAVPARSFGPAR